MKLSGPAQFVLGLGILSIIINGVALRKKPLELVVATVIGGCIVALAVYDTNCLSEGKCDTWAWIRTVTPYVIVIIAGFVGVNQK
jgi:hypothetical protein